MFFFFTRVSYRILSWGGGGGKQDGNRMIVACESTLTHAYVCMPISGGLGACPPPPRKILDVDPLRLLLMQSGRNFPNI